VSREAQILGGILVIVVAGMIGLFVVANKQSNAPLPAGNKNKIVRSDSHEEGTGPVQLVEFGDFQCPACGAAFPNVQQVLAHFKGDISFYFRNFPLTQLHPNAMEGANAAESAAAQGKYWQMHDKLYETQTQWADLSDPTSYFVNLAQSLGLNTNQFSSDLESKKYQSVINQDIADGNALGIDATPTFYINGSQYTGSYAYANLSSAIQTALTTKK
jgi:protein-disulfide isomerase